MKKFLFSNIFFLIGLLLTLSLFWPLFVASYFTHHDDVQVIRLFEMDKCIKDYQIPCRWVPDLGGLYGYPIFNYYAPLPYYFGEIVYLLTGSLLVSAKMMFAVSFLGAYIFMFLLAKKMWGKTGGSLAAIFYSFAPYHALDFYVRGAMGELWGLMFFPGLFWALIKLEEKVNILHLLLVSVMLFGLLTSHNLSAMLFLPLSVIWAIILFLKRKNRNFVYLSLGSLLLGVMLSAFYLLPASFEKNLVHLETMVSGYFSYTEHFKGFRKLLLEKSWGYGASVREVPGGERDGISYQIGWIHLLGLILALYSAKVLWKKNRYLSFSILFSTLVIGFAAFMIHPKSELIWKIIEPIKYLQFPWRFLILVTFFISLISGSFFLTNFKRKNIAWIILVFAVVFSNFSYFRPEKFIDTTDKERLEGENWDKQIKRSIFDYLPIYAKEPPAELAKERFEILTGESQILNFKEGTNWITFDTETQSHTIIRLSQYYFPDWKVYLDGKEAVVEYKNNNLGLMTLILGKGNHTVSAKLHDTPIRSVSNVLTVLGFLTTLILFLTSFPKVRKWILYYRKGMN